MKAVRIHKYGGVETLIDEDAPVPEFGPDEVLIKIVAASVNPVDWKIRDGHMKEAMKVDFPFILGWDVSGIIENTGALVTRFAAGDKVYARADTSRNGSYAEYITVRASEIAFAPDSIPLNFAAAVPLAAQTAWAGLFEQGRLQTGQRVLIHGASGGVGSFAVQLASIAGAHIIAVTSKKNVDFVRSLGANEVIEYTKEDFSKRVKDIDLVFDTIGGDTQKKSWGVIKKGGTLVSTVGADQAAAKEHHVQAKSFMVNSNGARLQEISGLIDDNKLKVIIEKEFTLKEIKNAHKLSEEGHIRGKVIINVWNGA